MKLGGSDIQHWLAQLIVEPRSLIDSSDHRAKAESNVASTGRLTPLEQLEIYREQFWFRHTGSLVEDFPGLVRLMTQSEWERLVEGYLGAHPPDSQSLRDLAKKFPDYVSQQSWLTRQPLLVDMARLEMAYLDSFDAADSPPFEIAELQALTETEWETATLVVAPSLRLLSLDYDVARVRRRLLRNQDAREVEEACGEAQTFVVVFRGPDRELWDKNLSEGAYRLLEALGSSVPLGRACDLALARVPAAAEEFEAQLAGWFASWARLGWICGVTLKSCPASHF